MAEPEAIAMTRARDAQNLPAFSGLSLNRLRSDIAEALSTFGRLGIFEEYTKHDIDHIDGLLKIYDWLIPKSTQEIMSGADWLLVTLASYLHDFGLLVTRTEYENRNTTAFVSYKEDTLKNVADNADLLAYLKTLDESRREAFLYQEFVRKHHAARIRNWLTQKDEARLGYDPAVTDILRNLLNGLDPTFVADLALVCESHHLDDIDDTHKYPVDKPYGPSREETANVQYAAILLRAADLLHITRDRTPSTAFQVISPNNPASQIEWAKQSAVRSVRSKAARNEEGDVDLEATRDTIEVHATFSDSDGFFGLTAYLQYANKEIAECNQWATNSMKRLGVVHQFPWRRIDPSHVEAIGFDANPFEFQIDQHKILELLTGHTLYNDTGVVVRELVQNSIDAVRLQDVCADQVYVPTVLIEWDAKGRHLSIIDNGTGMTQDVIESNFLRVGSSRYSDAKFIRRYPNYSPISRFGIGALSAFMVADDVQVVTVSASEPEARQLTLRTVHGQYLIKLLQKTDAGVRDEIRQHGTHISLKLRPSAKLIDVISALKKWIVIPRCEVYYQEKNGDKHRIGYENVSKALLSSMLELGAIVENESTITDNGGNKVEIRTSSTKGLDVAYAVRWINWFSEWSFFATPDAQQYARRDREINLGTCIEGIRVTSGTPGYYSTNIFAIADACGKGAPRTNVARDALETTVEYSTFLDSIYRVYQKHVTDELRRMSESGSSSVTRMTREATYLTNILSNQFPTQHAEEIFDEVIKDVPAFLVEESGARKALSLNQLAKSQELLSIDSQLVRHMEYVLDALPANVSLTTVLSELGGIDLALDSKWLLCGSMYSGVFAEAFRKTWEVAAIHANEDQQELTVTWRKLAGKSRWVSTSTTNPSQALEPFRRNFSRYSPGRGSAHVPISQTSLEYSGLNEYDIVVISGQRYVVPNSPLTRIRARDTTTDRRCDLAWVVSYFLQDYLDRRDARNHDSAVQAILAFAATESEFDFVDASSLREAFTSFQGRIFDTSRWERDVFGAHF